MSARHLISATTSGPIPGAGSPGAGSPPLEPPTSPTRRVPVVAMAALRQRAWTLVHLLLAPQAVSLPPRLTAPLLMNNTRLSYPDSVVLPTFVTNGSLDGMQQCLQFCIGSPTCGGMVWMAPYEPIRVPRPGCAKQRLGIDGCCYPAPVLDHYLVVNCTPHGDQPPCTTTATYGFISAIVRTNASKHWPLPPPPPPPPPPWVPATWEPSWSMNRSITLYWRNSTGVEPAEFYDGMGMAIFDWAHGSEQWANPEDGGPSDNGAVLAKQCEVIKKRQGKKKTHICCAI